MNKIYTGSLGCTIQFVQKEQVEKQKKAYLSQTRALLCPEEAPLVGIPFWNRTYPRIRFWSRSGDNTVIC